MGVIFSRFRKEKSTYQKLEKLEEKIKSIETYTIDTQRKQKRWVGGIRLFSVGFSIIAIIVYFISVPPTWRDRVIRASPSIISIFIMMLSRNLVAWYFERKVNRNSGKLSDLREEKKNLLEKVMDTETYKVAVDILNRFGDKPNFRPQQPPPITPTKQNQSGSNAPSNVPRIMPAQGYTPLGQPLTLQNRMMQTGRLAPISGTPGGQATMINRPNYNSPSRMNTVGSTPPPPGFIQRYDSPNRSSYGGPPNMNNSQLTPYNLHQKRTPFPIIDFENKGVFEKIIDRLIGDGPSDRFALICKECHKHNGMALEDEFYYSTFYCIFCNTLNPAKKLRPIAPSLPPLQPASSSGSAININPKLQRTYSSSSSASDSGEDVEAIEPNINDIVNEQIKEQLNNNSEQEEIRPNQELEPILDETPQSATESSPLDVENEIHNLINNGKNEDENLDEVANDNEIDEELVVIKNEVDEGNSELLDVTNDRIDKKPIEKKND